MSRILAIAPDPALFEMLQAAPALDGCEFTEAHGNVDALVRLAQRAYDVVLTNPETRVVEDLAMVSELRRVRPGVRPILLAPEAAPSDIVAALRARVFACFTVPFLAEEVIAMTAKAVHATDWHAGIYVDSALPDWISLRVTSAQVNAERLVRFVDELNRDVPETDRNELLAAFREMLLNAMEHGAGFDPEKVVDVTAMRTDRAIVYYMRDPGPGFSVDDVPHAAINNPPDDPLAHTALRDAVGLRPGGFGILLARGLVDEVRYSEHGNEVLLIKHMK
jgi:anti-sigma regulatory factor (Ser/Thr protein kinase)/CheY-like chemotaxis protein